VKLNEINLILFLNNFIQFIDSNFVEGLISEFNGTLDECIYKFIEKNTKELNNEKNEKEKDSS
jgi:hypothetical protein